MKYSVLRTRDLYNSRYPLESESPTVLAKTIVYITACLTAYFPPPRLPTITITTGRKGQH